MAETRSTDCYWKRVSVLRLLGILRISSGAIVNGKKKRAVRSVTETRGKRNKFQLKVKFAPVRD